MGNAACIGASTTVVSGVYDMDRWVYDWMGQPKTKLEIDWSGVQFLPETLPDYETEKPKPVKSLTVLHKETCVNDTSCQQTSRVTVGTTIKSFCEVSLTSGIKKDGAISVSLNIPEQVTQAKFPKKLQVTSLHQEFGHEYTYSKETSVEIPPGTCAHVTVCSKEEVYQSNFAYMVRVRGKVVVREYKEGTLKRTKESNMRELVEKLTSEKSYHFDGVEYGKTHITLPIKGNCRFQYVVNTDVHLQEETLI